MGSDGDVDERTTMMLLAAKPTGSHIVPELLAKLGLEQTPSKEQIYSEIEEQLLLPKNRFPDHWLSTYQVHWEHPLDFSSLYTTPPSDPPTTLAFIRTGLAGRIAGYTEVKSTPRSTAVTSTSLDRAPGSSRSFVRGKAGHVPFWPGGLDEVLLSEVDQEIPNMRGLRKVPPGFTRGLLFDDDDSEDESLLDAAFEARPGPSAAQDEGSVNGVNLVAESDVEAPVNGDIDELLPVSRDLIKPIAPSSRSLRVRGIQKRDWAHVVDIKKPMTNFHQLVPEMAHKYPFELDNFQKEAVYHLEMGDSVFVAAHTSAGKTVVAEYAIALAEKHMTRAIYTSPIKALSNQKYRDFKQTFSSSSVGILTGDVQINPEGNCLIMTTEILRSMLYRGADLIRDVEFVIFDEVHYVNDAERGVVWEEVIIMLPEHVSIILLSATLPNAKEFADWVGRTKKKDIYVIYTPTRPVPLEHYIYAGRDMYKIVDAKSNFISQGYKDAGEALRRKQDKEREAAGLPPVQKLGARAALAQGGRRGRASPARGAPVRSRGGAPGRGSTIPDTSLYIHLLGHLRKNTLLPVVIFTFSKKRCEENAAALTNLDLSTAVERSEIHVTIEKALSRLNGSDRKLPQIARMRDLLSRGIGVHHGGLLTIIKEVVELLFARGLVKVLFATETFAMGVNMPAKCVVFSGIRKHDGRSFREILPGEYTQMAGRAGRRGLDLTGTVVILVGDSLPEQTVLHHMMLGTPSKLQSQFRLTYNMILNLLRVEALKVEEMIKRSFSENASQRLLPDKQKQVVERENELLTLPKLECDICSTDIGVFYDISSEVVYHNQTLLAMAASYPEGAKSLGSGRVVILRDEHFYSNAAILLKAAPVQSGQTGISKVYFFLVLVDPETKKKQHRIDSLPSPPIWPPTSSSLLVQDVDYELVPANLKSVSLVTNRTIKIDVDAIVERYKRSSMQDAVRALDTLVREWCQGVTIPEVEWIRMRSLDFQTTLRTRNQLAERLTDRACCLCEHFEEHYALMHREKLLRADIATLKEAISDQNLDLIPDYHQRIGVLKELKFIGETSTVLLKGRVACEINSADELVLTELILENTLANYDPEETVALLSCFVFQEKTEVEPVISPKLAEGREVILSIAGRVGYVQDKHKVASEDLQDKLKFGLMEVVYEWAKGMPFEQITSLTDVAEGTVVRVITRLEETCREVRDAARVIGDAELMKKMEEAQTKIKRDIVFAASLYL